jgi:hypothetical protein
MAKKDSLRDPALMIRINDVKGNADKDKLKDCYFYPTTTDGVYLFCSKHDETLATGVRNDGEFSFHHDKFDWKIPNPKPGSEPFHISDGHARGSWHNNAPQFAQEEGGTFTAQATGGGVPEDASAAYAGGQ